MRKITPEQADVAYSILVRHAGAQDTADAKEAFVYHVSESPNPTNEYRFQGSLGFGGKFRNNGNNENVPYVDCYREDETPTRRADIIITNHSLLELFSGES